MNAPTARGRERSPSLAALLSFLWPGLGQLYTGKRRLAALFALPAVVVLLVLAYQLRQGLVVFAARFADPSFSLAAVAIVLVVGAWRLAAVTHAFASGERRRARRLLDRLVVVALVAVIIISHVGAGYLLAVTSSAGSNAFTHDSTDSLPTPASADSRVTILFTGVDADPTRSEHLYDSIMVVSFDPKTNSVQMVSVPRDSASFPLYFGGKVPVTTRINAVPTYVHNGWIKSPDSPYMTLVKEISYLVGIPINYSAVMDLGGFVKIIDMVGGIDVNNQGLIDDPSYDWLDGKPYGFYLAAGTQHLDGRHALAYVRSRHGSHNSDWARASRQQEVMVALLHKMSQPSQILTLPNLISTLGASVTTNFPANKVADYMALGQNIPKENFKQVVLGPPYTITNVNNINSAATTCLLNNKVAALSIQFFGQDSTWYGKPPPANTCP